MKKILLLLALTIPTIGISQIGGYAHVASETFYKKNLYVSVGAKYKEFKLGVFYQQAEYQSFAGTSLFTRKGIISEIGIGSVDNCAYFAVGARVMTANKQFVEIKPHGSLSFRFGKHIEIPIIISTYEKVLTGTIGLRCLF